ncbi:unnamed protein product [Closterium sp. NIES-53]
MGIAQWRQQRQQESFSPQRLRDCVSQRGVPGCVEAAALGASESDAALGASESAAALGASASTTIGPASSEALHTFTLDSGASSCFFRDCTTVTPLAAPVLVSLADPTWGLVVARASTVLPCPAVPFVSLSGLQLPSFSTNLVSNAVLQDVWVDTFIPGGQCVAICTCSRTGRHLATFTRQPGSTMYTPTTASTQVTALGKVAASSQASASGQFAASCSCRVLSHQNLLWHHRLGHPSLPRLRGMHSHLLVSGLPRSLPPLPRSPTPPCLPCVEGRQRAAPHSSSFPPTTAHLQTLHMDVWGPAPICGTDQERYFLLVVDNYTRYTMVFPLRNKADVRGVLIHWIRANRRQLRERFRQDLPVLRLHSNRGGEFSSDLLVEFCRDEGIVQLFTLPASPQQNGIAERRIGLIMEAAHQLKLWPSVSFPETSPTLHWTGKVGDASAFRVWGVLSLVRDTTARKLSPRTLRCAFLGFPTDAPPWQFYYPRLRRFLSSQDVTSDESICFYRFHPHASHPVPLAPLFLVPVLPSVDPLPPQGPAPSGVSQVDPPPLVEPLEISYDSSGPAEGDDPAADDTAATRRSPCLETPPGFPPRPFSPPLQLVAVDIGAAGGGDTGGEGSGGAEIGGSETGGACPRGADIGGEGSGGSDSGGADPGGAASPTGVGAVGAPTAGHGVGQQQPPSRLETPSPQQLHEWVIQRGRSSPRAWSFLDAGAAGAGGTAGGAASAGAVGDGGTTGEILEVLELLVLEVLRTRGAGAAGAGGATSVGGAGGAAGARGAGDGGTGGAGAAGPRDARPRGASAAGAGGTAGAGGAT